MNRLNFTQMVNKTIFGQQENKFFNITQINSDDFYENERYTAKIKQAQEKLNLTGKINNIVYHVHEKLRERQSSPNKLKANAIKQTFQKKPNLETKNIEYQKLSLPRLKVLSNKKHEEHAHNSTMTTSKIITFEDHQRMLKALKRQNELENMLQEQKFIKEDRMTLAKDIFAMRHCLNDLQHRLNYSLKQLDNKKTYCESHGIQNGKRYKN